MPYLLAIGTAVPSYHYRQEDIASFMIDYLQLSVEEARKLRFLYRSTAIQTRYSVLPDFGGKQPLLFDSAANASKKARMTVFQQTATPLAVLAIQNCLQKAQVSAQQITHLVTVSCTGMYNPGLDIDLINTLGFSSGVQRVNIGFMGCYGAFNGLKTADAFCMTSPNTLALVVCLELCTLHFQKSTAPNDLLAGSLFADGCAVALIGAKPHIHSWQFGQFTTHIFSEGNSEMAWHIGNEGFEMLLTSYVPALLSNGIQHMATLHSYKADEYAIHPGGKAILQEVAKVL